MNDDFYLNVPGMEQTARELSGAAGQLQGAIENLKAALARDDQCWGTDDIGKSFDQNYSGSADSTMTSVTNMAEAVRMLADENLPMVVSSLSGTDVDHAKVIDSYSDQLDSNTTKLLE